MNDNEINVCPLNPKHDRFIGDLQDLLKEYMEFENDTGLCKNMALSLLYEGINVIYINSPNKENFYLKMQQLFKHILEGYERVENK